MEENGDQAIPWRAALLITADGGGSKGSRCRLLSTPIRICRFSPTEQARRSPCYGQDIDLESPRFGSLDSDIQEAAKMMTLFTTSKRARWAYDRRMDWISRVKDWHIVD